MLTKRPLLDTAADQRLYVSDDSRKRAVLAALRGRNTLVVGDAGAGKTSVLYRTRAEASVGSPPRPAVFVDARLSADARELVELILLEAERQAWVPKVSAPAAEDPFGPVTQLRRLREASKGALVLIDDPTSAQALILFGRFRDELIQLPISFAVSVSPPVFYAVNHPPSDVFFDSVIHLDPLDPDAAFELLRLRKEQGHIPDQILWPSRAMQPRAILLDAHAGPMAGRHDASIERELLDLASTRVGRGGVMLVKEIWGRGAVSASDADLQRRVGVGRARLTQLLRELESAEILRSFPEAREGGIGRPKTMYDVNATRGIGAIAEHALGDLEARRGLDEPTTLAVREIATYLKDAIGPRMTAAIAGLGDPEQVDSYARGEGPQPEGAVERRLREGFKVVRILVDAYDADTARAWLFGTNSRLDEHAPIEVLGHARETSDFAAVVKAARQAAGSGGHRSSQ
jgi:hypothetical protein